jgi:N-acetylneuraminate synthase
MTAAEFVRCLESTQADSAARCLVIGEIAQAHDGSLGIAHAYIDAIAAAGADAVKFQTHIAAAESTPAEPWRVKFSTQDATRYEYWQRMEFIEAQWLELKQHADEKGLIFLSSPFSFEAIELLERVGVPAWKVASGEVNNRPLIEKMVETGKPVLLSSGMSTLEELDNACALVKSANLPLGVFQCTSAYPCPPEKIGLNLMSDFRERYNCAVGLSDHSGTIYPGLAAAALGANLVEVHVTFSREMFGPDVPASVTTHELRQLVEGVRFIEKMNANPIDKNTMTSGMGELRNLFTKSIVAREFLPAGTFISSEKIAFKKPGTGIPAEQVEKVLNRKLKRDIAADALLSEDDFE